MTEADLVCLGVKFAVRLSVAQPDALTRFLDSNKFFGILAVRPEDHKILVPRDATQHPVVCVLT